MLFSLNNTRSGDVSLQFVIKATGLLRSLWFPISLFLLDYFVALRFKGGPTVSELGFIAVLMAHHLTA